MSIRIGIVDDQQLFRTGVISILNEATGFDVVLAVNDAESCLEQLKQPENMPDVLLLDLEMEGMNGITLCEILQKEYPELKILVLSVHHKEKIVARMISLGASGYVVKNCEKEYFLDAIRSVHKNGFFMDEWVLKAIQRSAAQQSRSAKLFNNLNTEISEREIEVLKLICQEYSSAEIAEKLFIHVRTAEGHRNHLLIKTGCRNTAGLVLFAIKYDFFQLEL